MPGEEDARWRPWAAASAVARRAAKQVSGWTGRASRFTAAYVREHFPFEIRVTQRGEGMPPIAACWYKLLAAVICGAGAWTIIVAITHRRTAGYSALVALLVAMTVVWALGARFDLQTAVVTLMLTLLALILGDVVILILYRAQVIKSLDIGGSEIASVFYRTYFYRLIVWRLLPAAAIAFVVGLWPLPRRVGWRGFSSKEREAQTSGAGPRGTKPDKTS